MGGLVLKAIKHSGAEPLQCSANSLLEIGAKTIDGKEIEHLASVLEQKKCTLVVNVASK